MQLAGVVARRQTRFVDISDAGREKKLAIEIGLGRVIKAEKVRELGRHALAEVLAKLGGKDEDEANFDVYRGGPPPTPFG